MEVKGMSENKEALIVSIWSVCLNLYGVLFKKLPFFTIFETCLNEDTILVGGEILATNNLSNKMNLRFEVSLCAHLLIHFLNLLVLLILQVFHGLLVLFLVTMRVASIVLVELVAPTQCCPCIIHLPFLIILTWTAIHRLLLVVVLIWWRPSLRLLVIEVVVVVNRFIAVH